MESAALIISVAMIYSFPFLADRSYKILTEERK